MLPIARRTGTVLSFLTLVGVLLLEAAASAQSLAKTSTPRFEVASIKLCKPDVASGRRSGGENLSPGRLHLGCSISTVKGLVQMAYVLFANGHVNPPWSGSVPVNGGPAWINSDRYEIDAKAEAAQSQGMMHGPMLQTLLEDRFKLKVHRETGEVPVYELTVAKSGIKMQQLEEGSCTPVDFAFLTQFPPPPLPELPKGQEYCGGASADGSRWLGTSDTMDGPNETVEGRGMSLDDFCKIVIGNRLDRPVINKTGITKRFVFRLKFAPDEATPKFLQADEPGGATPNVFPDDPSRGPSIFTALQEQLGLNLVPAKGTGEFIVIDHVQRPSGN